MAARFSKADAMRRITEHLVRNSDVGQLRKGWPEGVYQVSLDPVWHLFVPIKMNGVGGSRCLVISQLTGLIVVDQEVGE